MFIKYQHIENNLNNLECKGLLDLTKDQYLIVQPKLDGTNCSVWYENEEIQVGSRNRQLSLSSDNANSYAILHNNTYLLDFFKSRPNYILYGEWLVKHHVDYVQWAYNRFYIFDMVSDDGLYIPYEQVFSLCNMFNLDCVPFTIVKDKSILSNMFGVGTNIILDYLLNSGCPEGAVVKNYFYKNQFGRQTWCKILHPAFSNHKPKSKKEKITRDPSEEFINLFLTEGLIRKTILKLPSFENKLIKNQTGRIIMLVKYDLIKEYLADYVINKKCTINFNVINVQVAKKVVAYMKLQENIL